LRITPVARGRYCGALGGKSLYMENLPFDFPMNLTIRCYGCGKVFDVVVTSRVPHNFPCPGCGKVEAFDLGEWEKKSIAWQKKMFGRSGGRR
jgi:hypothetical protein